MTSTYSNIINGSIEHVPRKTRDDRAVTAAVPLIDAAKELIQKHLDESRGTLFPFISEQNCRVLENAIDAVCRYTDLAFGDARNRFYGQQEVVAWLKACFEPLNRYDERTLRAKLRVTDGVSYTLHNNENLEEYMERNDKKR